MQFNKYVVKRVTPTIGTSAYADGDGIGTVFTFQQILDPIKKGTVISLGIVDESNQKAALTLHLFRASPTIGSLDNNALNIGDAELTAKFVTKIDILATDYESMTAGAVGSIGNINKGVDSLDGNLYGVLQSQGAPTYAGTDDLTFVLTVRID